MTDASIRMQTSWWVVGDHILVFLNQRIEGIRRVLQDRSSASRTECVAAASSRKLYTSERPAGSH
jgi:hypothetical protein